MEDTAIVCTFKFRCDKRWDDLSTISDQEDVRYCGECQKAVFLCTNYRSLARHAASSHCVAISDSGGELLLGDVFDPELDDFERKLAGDTGSS